MITKTNALKMSTRKWESLARGDKPKGYSCGFCEFFLAKIGSVPGENKMCRDCPLYPDICMDYDAHVKSLYHKCWRAGYDIKMAQQILDAIKERGTKWLA